MATATVGVSPVRGPRINQNLYVGQAGIRSIQAAVNYAAADGGIFVVVIPFGYNPADLISAVVNGSASIILSDQRGNNTQTHVWNGSAYVPADFYQMGAISASGNINAYSGRILLKDATLEEWATITTVSGNLSINPQPDGYVALNWSTAGKGVLFGDGNGSAVAEIDTTGTGLFRGVKVQVTLGAMLFGIDTFGSGIIEGLGPDPSTNGDLLLRVCASDGSNLVNVLQCEGNGDGLFWNNLKVNGKLTGNTAAFSGEVDINGILKVPGGISGLNSLAISGPLTVGAKLTAASAQITGVLTANSGTITTSLAVNGTLNANNAALTTGTVAGSPIRTFANSPDTGSGMEWPPVGIGVSTGSAWGTSIDPATLPRLAANNTFTGTNTFSGRINSNGIVTFTGGFTCNSMESTDNLILSSSSLKTIKLNYGLGGGGVDFCDGNGQIVGGVDKLGNAHFNGTLAAGVSTLAALSVTGAANVNGALTGATTATFATSVIAGTGFNFGQQQGASLNRQGSLDALNSSTVRLVSISDVTTKSGGYTFAGYSSDFQRNATYIQCYDDGGPVLNTIIDGNAHCNGVLSAGTKTFQIPHPLDATKDLIHGCLEGPEHSVFYRGEAKLKKGSATVELPDYFEALTFDDDRTVLLTVIVDDDKPVFGGQVAAGRIKGGKFKIYSTDQSAIVAWEVKAARRMDAGRLQVVRDKIKTATGANA